MDEKKVVKVIRIEVKSDKWGTKKVLTTDAGEEFKVGPKNKCYSGITANGDYELTMSEYNGKPFVKWAKLLKAADGSAPAAQATTAAKPNVTTIKTDPDKLAFEKRKQDEIRLEFYANLAKEVLIANRDIAEKKEPLSAKVIMEMAEEFAEIHVNLVEGKPMKAQEIEKIFNDEQNQDAI